MVRRIRDEYGDHVKFLTTPTLPVPSTASTAPDFVTKHQHRLPDCMHVELVGSFTAFWHQGNEYQHFHNIAQLMSFVLVAMIS